MTLWELTLTLAFACVAAGLAVPSFRDVMLSARLTADVNGFVSAVQLARSEAAKRGRSVILCKTADRERCGGTEIDFDAGWMVFVDEDGGVLPARSAAEPLLFAYTPTSSGTIKSNRPVYEFRAFRRRSTNGTVTFCDARGGAAARAVIVSYTGRPRVALGTPTNPLFCAGLP